MRLQGQQKNASAVKGWVRVQVDKARDVACSSKGLERLWQSAAALSDSRSVEISLRHRWTESARAMRHLFFMFFSDAGCAPGSAEECASSSHRRRGATEVMHRAPKAPRLQLSRACGQRSHPSSPAGWTLRHLSTYPLRIRRCPLSACRCHGWGPPQCGWQPKDL